MLLGRADDWDESVPQHTIGCSTEGVHDDRGEFSPAALLALRLGGRICDFQTKKAMDTRIGKAKGGHPNKTNSPELQSEIYGPLIFCFTKQRTFE